MQQWALEILQAFDIWPLPFAQRADTCYEHIGGVLYDFARVELLNSDVLFRPALVLPGFDAFVPESHVLADVVFACDPLPVPENLWCACVEL